MTLHKYLSIINQWQFTETHVYAMIAAAWFIPITLNVAFVVQDKAGTLQGIQSSMNYCVIAMDGTDSLNTVGTIFILGFIIGTICFLVGTHVHIIRQYQMWKQSHMRQDKQRLYKEGLLIKKSVAIAGIFSLAWSVFIFKGIYEAATHLQVPLWLDVGWEVVGTMLPMTNLVILYIYDAKFKQNLVELGATVSAAVGFGSRVGIKDADPVIAADGDSKERLHAAAAPTSQSFHMSSMKSQDLSTIILP